MIDGHSAETAGLQAKHIMEIAALSESLRLTEQAVVKMRTEVNGNESSSGSTCEACAAYVTQIEAIKSSQIATEAKGNAQENELGDMQVEVDALRSLVPTLQKEIGTITETAEQRRLTLNEFAKEKHSLLTDHTSELEAANLKHGEEMATQVKDADERLLKAVAESRTVITMQAAEICSLDAKVAEASNEVETSKHATAAALQKFATSDADLATRIIHSQAAEAELEALKVTTTEAKDRTAILQSEVIELTSKMTELTSKAGNPSRHG